MKLNTSLPHILRSVYVYDVISCHYNLMQTKGFVLGGLDQEEKIKRNIAIGKRTINSPDLGAFLRTSTGSIVQDFLDHMGLKDDDIVIIQYDGFISRKKIGSVKFYDVSIEIRKTFEVFIASIDYSSYIAIDTDNQVTVKGVSQYFPCLEYFYRKLLEVVTKPPTETFKTLQAIKEELHTTENMDFFMVPVKDESEKYMCFLKDYGELTIDGAMSKMIGPEEIDRDRYFVHYIEPFTKAIVYDCFVKNTDYEKRKDV